jgi:sugar phosphate isomerase/epimerase
MSNISRRRFNQIMGIGGLSALSTSSLLAAVASGNEEAEDPIYDIAFSSWCFHLPLWRGELKAQALPGIARDLGVDALEWTAKTFRDLKGGREVMYQVPPEGYFHTLREAADDAGVQNKVINVGGPFFLASGDDTARQQALDFIMQYVEPAQILGTDILRTELYYDGDRGPGWEQEALERAAEGVRRLLEKTANSGLKINVENHHGISSHPEWLASLVETVDSPRFALTVDTNNFRVDQDNPYNQDPSALPEYVDRYEGLRTLMPFANWVSAKCYAFDSTGYEISMDYPRIVDIILAGGYRGYISVEYEGADDPMDGVRQSVDMFKALRSHFTVSAERLSGEAEAHPEQ